MSLVIVRKSVRKKFLSFLGCHTFSDESFIISVWEPHSLERKRGCSLSASLHLKKPSTVYI